MPLSRRELLRRAAIGAAGLTVGRFALPDGLTPAASAAEAFTTPLPIPEVLTDADITLRAAESFVQLLPGPKTKMWTFNGTFPGPTIRRPAGETTRVTVVHDLPAEAKDITIHHHGSHSASEHDGQPDREVIEPGGVRTYVYEHMEDGEPERAALQWYHDHSHHRTSFNSWMGLGGLFILDDEFEAGLPLPRGEYDIPLFITDRTFDTANQLQTTLFNASAHSREVSGQTYLVNGAVQPYAEVEPRRYRLRFHNGANFVLYNLALLFAGDRMPLTQIATESGLLPRAAERDTILLGPAERAEVIVDFADFAGQTLTLASVARGGSRPLEMAARVAQLVQFRVGTTVTEPDEGPLPTELRPLPAWVAAADRTTPDRVWVFGRGVELNPTGSPAVAQPHTINGRAYDHDRIDAKVELDSVETWLLMNASDRGHWIHIHNVDWVVLSRNGAAPADHENGLKETFRLDPGEVLLVAAKFPDHLGEYMIHCHMLDHEDSGMMTAWEVVEPGAGTPTTLTRDEQVRTDALLTAMRARPGKPAPLPLVQRLATSVVVSDEAGTAYTCDLR